MSKNDPGVVLRQMFSHAQEAVSICEGKTRMDLDGDRLLNLALTRLIEMMGEAANRDYGGEKFLMKISVDKKRAGFSRSYNKLLDAN